MDTFWGLWGLLVSIAFAVFALGGVGMGWYSYFQIRQLKEELAALRRARPETPKPEEPSKAPVAETITDSHQPVRWDPPPQPHPAASPTRAPATVPRQRSAWERRFLENWTGLAGLVIITLGLGFLTAYAAAVMSPFGRFLLIVAGAVVSAGAGVFLVKRKPLWTKWGYWLQSLGAAVFLLACLGSGGIPGVAWVTHPLAALALLLLGVAVNFWLGSSRRSQPYLTLHVGLSLTALAVPGPGLLILVFQALTAFLGIGLSWFQKWPYNRAVTVGAFQALLVAARLRAPEADLSLQLAYLGASAALALLVHFASYRRLEQAQWSRAAFVTHLVNAAGAGLAIALWAPHHPLLQFVVLLVVALVLAVLASRARRTGTSWLYRTDRLLALAVAGLVLALNPLGALPLVLAAGFTGLVLVLAWLARREGDALLVRISEILVAVSLALLPLAALVFQPGTDRLSWAWGAASCFAAGAVALVYFGLGAEGSGRWRRAALILLPATFAFPLVGLLGETSPLPGVGPGLILLAPWVGLAWLLRRHESPALAWGLAAQSWLVSLVAWLAWIWGTGWGPSDAVATVVRGLPLWVLTLVPLFVWKKGGVFQLVSFLAAVAGLALLIGFTLAGISPALPGAGLLGCLVLVFALRRPIEAFNAEALRPSLWIIAACLVVSRLLIWGEWGWAITTLDAAAIVVFAALALYRAGAAPFWELALGWGLWFFWFDLPQEFFPLLVAVLALGSLLAGLNTKAARLPWYSVALFVAANLLTLITDSSGIKIATLVVLVVYLVVDSLLRPPVPGFLDPYRRYALVLVQGAAVALALPSLLDPRTLTFGWSLESALLFLLAVLWKDSFFKNASFVALAACLLRLLLVDLSNSDILTKAITFLSVGALLVGMNVLYQWSKNRPRS